MNTSLKRINMIFDENSFIDHYPVKRSHFICGEGTINSVRTFLVLNRGQDCEFHGNRDWRTAEQIISTITLARDSHRPLLYIQDKPGNPDDSFDTKNVLSSDMSRLLLSPSGMGRVSASLAELAEKNLLVSAILGPTTGPLALPLMLADLVLMTQKGALCMGRPDMVKAMLAQDTELYSLGGPQVHSKESGSVQFVFESEKNLFEYIRILFSYVFSGKISCEFKIPKKMGFDKSILSNHGMPYDMRDLLCSFIDKNSLLELSPQYAREVLTGFVTINGQAIATVANNPKYNGGAIHRESVNKIVKILKISGKFEIPVLFIADVPGFMIGKEAERSGIFSAAADLFRAHIQCKVPKLLLVARKAYTGGVYAMGGPGFDPIAILSYPQANIGVFSVDTMNKIVDDAISDEKQKRIAVELSREISNPVVLKDKELITEVINPEQTRDKIVEYLLKPAKCSQKFGGFERVLDCRCA
jgi:acetyl-CoA carboxylase carboxyltransferase component